MQIEILNYLDEPRGFKLGFVDIRVLYPPDKSETFRNLAYFNKDGKRWLSFPNCKRGDKWLPFYERTPEVSKNVLTLALEELDLYFRSKEPQAVENKPINEPEPVTDMF